MIIGYKTVNNSDAKGIIVTAETIMDFRRWLDGVNATPATKEGAKAVVDFLDEVYRTL